jgi:hypothetical protein
LNFLAPFSLSLSLLEPLHSPVARNLVFTRNSLNSAKIIQTSKNKLETAMKKAVVDYMYFLN